MRLDDAKVEVLERISKMVGARISENDLTFFSKTGVDISSSNSETAHHNKTNAYDRKNEAKQPSISHG